MLADFAIGLFGTEVMGGPDDGERRPAYIVAQMMLSPLAAKVQGVPHEKRLVELAFSGASATALAKALTAAAEQLEGSAGA